LSQITGKRQNRKLLFQLICKNILEIYNELDTDKIRTKYTESLYRRVGFYPFETNNELFQAKILGVEPDGRLDLETENGEVKSFYFKEVRFLI
jgi:BirA family biotin operon repressor/biotin-[acetyl-CoA-carboxylase] ligase